MGKNKKTDPVSRFVRLSYDLTAAMPVYPGNPADRIKPVDSFNKGQNCRTFSLSLFNHNGTHIDAPAHFDRRGRGICGFDIGEFVFQKPKLIDIPKKAGEEITAGEIAAHDTAGCDLLLIRTGFFLKRKSRAYAENNPWLGPAAALYIRKECKIRAIGVDTISIGSHRFPSEAASAHQILLKKGQGTPPLIIVEDLNLGKIEGPIKRFFAVPLYAAGVDSMPCTAFMEVSK